MVNLKIRLKQSVSYLCLLCMTIFATSLTTKAAIIDWFVSESYVTKIVIIIVCVIVGIVLLVFLIGKYNLVSKVGTTVKKIKL